MFKLLFHLCSGKPDFCNGGGGAKGGGWPIGRGSLIWIVSTDTVLSVTSWGVGRGTRREGLTPILILPLWFQHLYCEWSCGEWEAHLRV